MYIEKDLFFTKANGKRIVGKMFIPDEGDNRIYPTVIYSHGFNSCFNAFLHHGPDYAKAGIISVFFDFCGGGEATLSDGTLEEMTVLTEVEDLLYIIAEVAKLDNVDEKNIFLLGESMGGFVSAYVAGSKTDNGKLDLENDGAKLSVQIPGLILWYPAFVIPEDSKRRFENNDNTCFGLAISKDFNATSKDIDIYAKMSSLSVDVLLIHGDRDPVVPVDYSKKALHTYKNASLEIIKGAGHGFEENDSKRARELSINFILKHANYSEPRQFS